MEKKRPQVSSKLRRHLVLVPEEVYAASGILIWGRRVKSLVFTTDLAIIRNCNADAVLAVYPFTPQQVISDAIIHSSFMPVFCGVGGGITGGPRVAALAQDAEAEGAMGVVVNAPTTDETIRQMHEIIDIPIVVTVLNDQQNIDARLEAGASILNVSCAENTPALVKELRRRYPNLSIIATGGPSGETIARTVDAGANAISYTPPTTKELFRTIMQDYRENGLDRFQPQ